MLWLLAALIGCSREDYYAERSLYDNIREVYEDCEEGKIKFLKRKANIQTLFTDCGSNNIYHYNWSPDGRLFYFQLFTNNFIMNPENQGVDQLPIGKPIGRGIWLHETALVVPIIETDDGPPMLSIYLTAGMMQNYEIPGTKPADLQVYQDKTLLLTMIDESGKRRPYFFSEAEGFSRAFNFLDSVLNIDVAQGVDLLSYTNDSGNHLTTLSGESLADFPTVKRGIPHPDGKYVALELDGAPLPPIDLGDGKYKNPEVRKREEKRRQQKIDSLPDWVPKELIPPEINIYNVEQKRRYRIKNFFGERFEWYPKQKYFCSFFIKGIEGQLIQQNIALTDIGVALLMADNDNFPSSIEMWTPIEKKKKEE